MSFPCSLRAKSPDPFFVPSPLPSGNPVIDLASAAFSPISPQRLPTPVFSPLPMPSSPSAPPCPFRFTSPPGVINLEREPEDSNMGLSKPLEPISTSSPALPNLLSISPHSPSSFQPAAQASLSVSQRANRSASPVLFPTVPSHSPVQLLTSAADSIPQAVSSLPLPANDLFARHPHSQPLNFSTQPLVLSPPASFVSTNDNVPVSQVFPTFVPPQPSFLTPVAAVSPLPAYVVHTQQYPQSFTLLTPQTPTPSLPTQFISSSSSSSQYVPLLNSSLFSQHTAPISQAFAAFAPLSQPTSVPFSSSLLPYSASQQQYPQPFQMPAPSLPNHFVSSSSSSSQYVPLLNSSLFSQHTASIDVPASASSSSSDPISNSSDDYMNYIPFTSEIRPSFSTNETHPDFPPLVPPRKPSMPHFSRPDFEFPIFSPISCSLASPIPTPNKSVFGPVIRASVLTPSSPSLPAILLPTPAKVSSATSAIPALPVIPFPIMPFDSSLPLADRFRLSPLFKKFYIGAKVNYYRESNNFLQKATILNSTNTNEIIRIEIYEGKEKTVSINRLEPIINHNSLVLVYDAKKALHFFARKVSGRNNVNCVLLNVKNLQKSFPRSQLGDFYSFIPLTHENQLQGLVQESCNFGANSECEGFSGFGYRLLSDTFDLQSVT